MVVTGLGNKEICIEDGGTEGAEVIDGGEVIESVNGDTEISVSPLLEDILFGMTFPDSDNVNAGGFCEFDDVFWGPIWVGVESVNNGFPGIKSHNLIKHVWVINLYNKAIEH